MNAMAAPVETRKVPEDPKVRQVARNFESLFVNQLVSEMRKTIEHDGLIPQSHAEKVYQSMLDTEYSQRISDSGQIGLSDLIYQHLMRSR